MRGVIYITSNNLYITHICTTYYMLYIYYAQDREKDLAGPFWEVSSASKNMSLSGSSLHKDQADAENQAHFNKQRFFFFSSGPFPNKMNSHFVWHQKPVFYGSFSHHALSTCRL